MFYSQALKKAGNGGKQKITISDFSGGMNTVCDEDILPLKYAKSAFNFDYSKGVLRSGLGLREYCKLPDNEEASGMFLYRRYDPDSGKRDDRQLFFSSTGNIYFQNDEKSELKKLNAPPLDGKIMAANYRLYSEDVVLICAENSNMLVWNGIDEPYFIENSPHISSMTVHYERLFATADGEKSTLWFSDDLDPTNWEISLTGGGFIEMVDERGALNKVISYQNYIYVFRDYGISRVAAYADQSDFSVSHLFVSSGKIYADTVCLCGDRLIFLAEDGLYAFDGVSTGRILGNFEGLINYSKEAVAAYSGGKYYLAANMTFPDEGVIGCERGGHTNNALICYDLRKQSAEVLRGVDIAALYSQSVQDESVLLAQVRGDKVGIVTAGEGAIFSVPTEKMWESSLTDLGSPEKTKIVRQIFLRSKYPCKLILRSEKASREFQIDGSDSVIELKTVLRGRLFGFSIHTNEKNARIKAPTLLVST